MAGLTVLDASVLLAHLDDTDEHADAALTILADCPEARAFSIYDRCHICYERYYGCP